MVVSPSTAVFPRGQEVEAKSPESRERGNESFDEGEIVGFEGWAATREQLTAGQGKGESTVSDGYI